MASPGPVRAFLSYAHEDHAWRDRVLQHLGWLRHSNVLQVFEDRQIKPGEQWDPRIKRELENAQISIVLISPSFVGSRYCTIEELVRTVERQRQGSADLVGIYCDHVDLEALPLASHQCLPQDEANDLKPLCDWPNPNLPLSRIAAAVRRMVEARRPATPAPPPTGMPASPSAPTPGLPPRGRFIGRQADLDQLLAWVLDAAPDPIAVLGPGGIGKSKLTIAASHHQEVAARFGERRLFVRLEDVRDEAGVYQALARELRIEPGPQPIAAVSAALRAAPALAVLDNAETPWEADMAAVEEAYARLAEIPGLRLVASLRGFELPGVATWRPLLLEPLPEEAARTLFLAAAGGEGPRYRDDPDLPRLLARLDGLPLAIELVAQRAQVEPGAAAVLEAWEAQRAAFVRRGAGGKKQLDLSASIALSLKSPRMSDDGRHLFALLGRLPHGLAAADLTAVMPGRGGAAAATLRRTGLLLRDAARLRMLVPVREYAADEPLRETDRQALVAWFGALADGLPFLWTEPGDPQATRRAREELTNIEAVLGLEAAQASPEQQDRVGWRWIRVGDARWSLGSSGLAAQAYQQAHSRFRAALDADPGNAGWQRDLSVSHEKIGDVRTAQGDLVGALKAYGASLAIAERLAARDPGNAGWQRDLSVSHNKIGDVRRAQGDLAGALEAYGASLAIHERLAARDPGNAAWQRDLIVSHVKLAIMAEGEGSAAEVRRHYEAALTIARDLAGSGRLAPADAWMVGDLEARLDGVNPAPAAP